MLAKSSSYRKESLVLHKISNAESSSSQIALVKIIREVTITQIKIKLRKLDFFIFEVNYWGPTQASRGGTPLLERRITGGSP